MKLSHPTVCGGQRPTPRSQFLPSDSLSSSVFVSVCSKLPDLWAFRQLSCLHFPPPDTDRSRHTQLFVGSGDWIQVIRLVW